MSATFRTAAVQAASDATVEGRMFHDIAGHYNRFDVLQLKVDRRALGPVAE